jgi:hypothetical protein
MSKNPTATDLVQSLAALEARLRDLMIIMAAIAYTQEDKMFSVPVAVISEIAGASVDFSFNKKTQEYEFQYVPPAPEPSAGLILPVSVHPDASPAKPAERLKGEI